jgi:hypothetical protein
MKIPKRNYQYKGADTSRESRLFWIMVVIGLALVAAIIFLF